MCFLLPPTEAVILRIEVLVSLFVGHDVGALQAEIERAKGHDRFAIRVDVRLRYHARFIVYELEDRSVMLKGRLARILKHLAHMFYTPRSAKPCVTRKQPTTAIHNMRHLAARHNIAFRILDHLGRSQRRRLRARSCVHGAGCRGGYAVGCSFT